MCGTRRKTYRTLEDCAGGCCGCYEFCSCGTPATVALVIVADVEVPC